MTAETWKLVREWFHGASALRGAQLAAFLDTIPEAGLRREVETLLEAAAVEDSVLDNPALPGMPEALSAMQDKQEDASQILQPGEVAGGYEVIRLLGQGGSGSVYQARARPGGALVALKVLRETVHMQEEQRRRFLSEARILTSLRHANIVSVLGVFESEGRLVIVMEWIDGTPLGDYIVPGSGMPVEAAVRIARDIAAALEEAHRSGITHRDLKPGNIVISRDEGQRVKLLDFGAAKQSREPQQKLPGSSITTTANGMLIGSPAYMSPEQAEGEPVDARSDVFSFGTLLYEMISGVRVFERKTMFATMSAVIREQPAPVATVARQLLPERLGAIIHRCLRKDPRLRFVDGQALRKALDRL